MEITNQSQSVLQQIQQTQRTQQAGISANNADSQPNNASSTADSISISSEARARLEAEQQSDNTMQLQGSGEINGPRPK